MNRPPESATLDACCFIVSGHHFAVESACVEEILRGGRPTRVPLAPPEVSGVLHLRGRIVPMIDMGRRLRLSADGTATIHVIIRSGDEWYGLLVDDVLGVQSFARDRIESPGGESLHDPRIGVIAADGHLVHLLDPQRIVQPLFRQRTSPVITHGASHVGSVA
jgi:purine-binding chemotaxis protein CheW